MLVKIGPPNKQFQLYLILKKELFKKNKEKKGSVLEENINPMLIGSQKKTAVKSFQKKRIEHKTDNTFTALYKTT